jgi:hypothetical protein
VDFGDEPVELEPESATLARQPGTFTGETDVLAGEATREHVGKETVCGESIGGETAHVVVDRHAGPVFVEYLSAEPVDFTEGDSLESSCSFKSE